MLVGNCINIRIIRLFVHCNNQQSLISDTHLAITGEEMPSCASPFICR